MLRRNTFFLFIVPLLFPGIGLSGNLDQLHDYQQKYVQWTDQNFSSILSVEDYSGLSDPTKNELGQYWEKQLQELLNDHNTGGGYGQEDRKKWQSINVLANLEYQPAVNEILQVATENVAKDNRERWMAVRALGILGDDSVVPDLIHLIYHYNMNTRLWAQISLVQITGQNFGYDWQAWCEWWNQNHQDSKCSLQPVEWELPPNADSKWSDPDFQKQNDLQQLGLME